MFPVGEYLPLFLFCRELKRDPSFSIFRGGMILGNKYFTELARRLRAGGITTGHPKKNRLTVLLNDQPVLFVSSGSDVFLLPAGSNHPEASELYHKAAQTADEVYAYAGTGKRKGEIHITNLAGANPSSKENG